MQVKRIRAGEYDFINSNGVAGSILKQPEGGWTVFDPNAGHIMSNGERSGDTLDFFMTYGEAKGFASKVK